MINLKRLGNPNVFKSDNNQQGIIQSNENNTPVNNNLSKMWL